MGDNNTDLRETHIIGRQTQEQIVDGHDCPALGLYGLKMVGLSHAVAPFRFIRPEPHIHQLLVCLGGWGQVWHQGGWERCESGWAYIAPLGAFHGYRAVQGVRWRIAWVVSASQSTLPLADPEAPRLLRADVQPLGDSILGLYRESMGVAEPAVLHHWTHLIHTYAGRMTDAPNPDDRMRVLWESVDAHLSHRWTVAELATQAGISGEHLRRLCLTRFGRSPMRHVAFLRMRRAAALLASETYTIEAVAQQIGYENAFAFSTAFRRHTRVSPSEYRGQRPVR